MVRLDNVQNRGWKACFTPHFDPFGDMFTNDFLRHNGIQHVMAIPLGLVLNKKLRTIRLTDIMKISTHAAEHSIRANRIRSIFGQIRYLEAMMKRPRSLIHKLFHQWMIGVGQLLKRQISGNAEPFFKKQQQGPRK